MKLLIFASSSQRQELFVEIMRNSLLRKKYSLLLFEKDISNLGKQTLSFNPAMSPDDAIQYSFFLVKLYSERINNYVRLREQYERSYLLKNYKAAREILDCIDNEVCISLWSCGQRFLLAELERGLEANKEELTQLSSMVPQNYSTLAILHHYSSLAESNLSYDNYQLEVNKFLKPLGTSDLGRYLTKKLSLDTELSKEDISLILQIDSQYSIIDVFNDLEFIIPLHYQKNIISGKFSFIISAFRGINAPLVRNLQLLSLDQDEQTHVCDSGKDDLLYQIVEFYTIGNYEDVLTLTRRYLNAKPYDFQVAVLYCKALIHLNLDFPIDHEINYVKSIYSIYKIDENYRESVLALQKELKQNHGSVLKTKIRSFLHRKHLLDIKEDCSFISSLLDESLHPNFCRFLSDSVLSHFESILSPKCPTAVSFSYALKNKVEIPKYESKIEQKRLAVFYADVCLSTGDLINAQKHLDNLARVCSSDDLYLSERIRRLQLKLYSISADYHGAIRLYVDSFFKNEHLYERLIKGNHIQIPKRLRSRVIEADINYVIYVYLLERTNYSRQISAYSNYLELNHFSSVFDALRFSNTDDHLCTFFFDVICSVSLLKNDATLYEANITPEHARLRILNILNERTPSKHYASEINNLSTLEVMRENLKSINKSRINVDVDKILLQHNYQWQETYQKYLRLSKTDKKFISIDFNELELNEQLTKLVENLNLQIVKSPQINQETMVLRGILEQIVEECLFSTQYGLETYLSSRIRHGYCSAQLTSFLSELNLISLRKKDDSAQYVNEFWENEFRSSPEVQAEVNKQLSKFTLQIERKIEEVCKEWLRIKYKEYTIGMFDYSSLVDSYIYGYHSEVIMEFTIFYSRVISLFWLKTNLLLKDIRERITGELQKFYNDAIEALENDLRAIVTDSSSDKGMKKLLSNCTKSKARVVAAMEQFKDVFTTNNAHYNNFTMKDLSSSCKKAIERLYPGSDKANWSINADSNLVFDGKYFLSFVDVLSILLNNSITHSGLRSEHLKIDIDITEIPDAEKQEIYDTSSCINSTHQHIMRLQVRNNLDNKVDSIILREQLDKIFQEICEEQPNRKLVQGEGGSGLHKLCKTIDYNIEALYYIGYEVEHHSISIFYVFVADTLLHQEE